MVYSDGEKHYSTEGNADLLGARHWGVLSGLQVTENTTPDMSVLVAAGSCIVNATEITKTTSTNVTISAADDTNPRWDIITINDAGTIAATAGTPAADPYPPALPANNILLALVYVAAGVSQITNANIYDRRLFIEKIKNVHVDDAAGIAESKLALNYPTHPKLHAADHGSGGADAVSLDASQITTGTLSLDRIPNTLTGKDADLWDGYHRTDNQILGGNITIGNTLKVSGNAILDSGGNTVLSFDGTGKINCDVAIKKNNAVLELESPTSDVNYPYIGLKNQDRTWKLQNDLWGRYVLFDETAAKIRFYVQCGGAETDQFCWLNSAGTAIMWIDYEGDLYAGSYDTYSLRELKTDIQDFDLDALNLIKSLRVRKFKLKANPTKWRYGFVAEEIPDVFKSYREGKLQGYNLTHIVAVLVAVVKKLLE